MKSEKSKAVRKTKNWHPVTGASEACEWARNETEWTFWSKVGIKFSIALAKK